MKKSNAITLLVLVLLVAAIFVGTNIKKSHDENTTSSEESTTTTQQQVNSTTKDETSKEPLSSTNETTMTQQENKKAELSDALFIGDSRTVGIMEYAGISEADFFCDTGMSVFNLQGKRISVPDVGKVTLEELLTNKKYGKIYVMLGINELGYNFDSIVKRYKEVIDYIEGKQPQAYIIIEANLHVTKVRSDSDKTINNSAIDKLNAELKKLCTKDNEFYIDINEVFDDSQGALDKEKTSDNAHLYAKYYAQWGEWIKTQTAKFIKEG